MLFKLRYTLLSPLQPAQAAERLSIICGTENLSGVGERNVFTGTADSTGFELTRKSFMSGFLQPVLIGMIISKSNGSKIEIVSGMNSMFVFILLAVSILILIAGFQTALQGVQNDFGYWAWISVTISIVFFLAGIIHFSWHTRKSVDIIKSALDAAATYPDS